MKTAAHGISDAISSLLSAHEARSNQVVRATFPALNLAAVTQLTVDRERLNYHCCCTGDFTTSLNMPACVSIILLTFFAIRPASDLLRPYCAATPSNLPSTVLYACRAVEKNYAVMFCVAEAKSLWSSGAMEKRRRVQCRRMRSR